MNAKVLVGGIIGGLAFFLLGYLFYGLLMVDTLAKCTSCQRPMEEINFVLLGLGNLFIGWTIAYIYSRMAGVASFSGGMTAGALIGFLLALGFNLIDYATSTTVGSMTCMIYLVVIHVVMWGIVGGLIGWWIGRK